MGGQNIVVTVKTKTAKQRWAQLRSQWLQSIHSKKSLPNLVGADDEDDVRDSDEHGWPTAWQMSPAISFEENRQSQSVPTPWSPGNVAATSSTATSAPRASTGFRGRRRGATIEARIFSSPFQLGELVECCDEGETKWKIGIVTCLTPLEVK